MTRQTLERLQQQLRGEAWIGAMVAVVVLTLLAGYLFFLKPAMARYRELAGQNPVVEIENAGTRAETNASQIAALEVEVEELRGRLFGGPSNLPREKVESYVIDRLHRISVRHDVRLVGVKPMEAGRVLMFEELPYDVEVAGDYFALFAWLQAVEEELRPMVVKRFEMSGEDRSDQVKMNLRLVSYRPLGEVG